MKEDVASSGYMGWDGVRETCSVKEHEVVVGKVKWGLLGQISPRKWAHQPAPCDLPSGSDVGDKDVSGIENG